MYLNLSIRNAKRSFTDYLLYITAMAILLSVMAISECIAISGKASGFQTASLPILIAVIQIILVSSIDRFMLKQRAKEFASYLLLGMEKSKLVNLFLLEFFLIGVFCFGVGTTLGFAVYAMLHSIFLPPTLKTSLSLYGQSLLHCLLYFCLVEVVCAFHLKRHLGRLQIRELMHEKNRSQIVPSLASDSCNLTSSPHTFDRHGQSVSLHISALNGQPMPQHTSGRYRQATLSHSPGNRQNMTDVGWGISFLSSFACFLAFLLGIVFLPENNAPALISIIAIPLLRSVYTFYRWFFGFLCALRKNKPIGLFQNDRLYLVAGLTASFRTNALINAVFSVCLLFSSMAFFFGILMFQPEIRFFDRNIQVWMGTAQICLCIIFLVIYFFLLSLRQAMELKRSAKDIPIMHSIGKDKKQLLQLINRQIHIGLTLPMLITIPIILFSIPLLNRKLNYILPESLHNILMKSFGCFFLCILLFYFCFYGIVNVLSRKNSR